MNFYFSFYLHKFIWEFSILYLTSRINRISNICLLIMEIVVWIFRFVHCVQLNTKTFDPYFCKYCVFATISRKSIYFLCDNRKKPDLTSIYVVHEVFLNAQNELIQTRKKWTFLHIWNCFVWRYMYLLIRHESVTFCLRCVSIRALTDLLRGWKGKSVITLLIFWFQTKNERI